MKNPFARLLVLVSLVALVVGFAGEHQALAQGKAVPGTDALEFSVQVPDDALIIRAERSRALPDEVRVTYFDPNLRTKPIPRVTDPITKPMRTDPACSATLWIFQRPFPGPTDPRPGGLSVKTTFLDHQTKDNITIDGVFMHTTLFVTRSETAAASAGGGPWDTAQLITGALQEIYNEGSGTPVYRFRMNKLIKSAPDPGLDVDAASRVRLGVPNGENDLGSAIVFHDSPLQFNIMDNLAVGEDGRTPIGVYTDQYLWVETAFATLLYTNCKRPPKGQPTDLFWRVDWKVRWFFLVQADPLATIGSQSVDEFVIQEPPPAPVKLGGLPRIDETDQDASGWSLVR